MTGIRMEGCFSLTSLARSGSPPAFLMQTLFLLDLLSDHRAKALPLATCRLTGRASSLADSTSAGIFRITSEHIAFENKNMKIKGFAILELVKQSYKCFKEVL